MRQGRQSCRDQAGAQLSNSTVGSEPNSHKQFINLWGQQVAVPGIAHNCLQYLTATAPVANSTTKKTKNRHTLNCFPGNTVTFLLTNNLRSFLFFLSHFFLGCNVPSFSIPSSKLFPFFWLQLLSHFSQFPLSQYHIITFTCFCHRFPFQLQQPIKLLPQIIRHSL